MKNINNEATYVINGKVEGKVGAAILIPKSTQVVDKGTRGDEKFAWVKINTCNGVIGIESIYAPNESSNERSKQIELWKWLKGNLEQEQWILC